VLEFIPVKFAWSRSGAGSKAREILERGFSAKIVEEKRGYVVERSLVRQGNPIIILPEGLVIEEREVK